MTEEEYIRLEREAIQQEACTPEELARMAEREKRGSQEQPGLWEGKE